MGGGISARAPAGPAPTTGALPSSPATRRGLCRSDLASIGVACAHVRTHVTVLVNGTTDDSVSRATQAANDAKLNADIYSISYPDKSNAWNQFVYTLRPNAGSYFFVDGYTRVSPDALSLLATYIEANPGANAASACPISGRSAVRWRDDLMKHGGVVGCLHVLPRQFVDRIVNRQILLPTGLYRGDGLLNSVASHDCDAVNSPWNRTLAGVVPKAGFAISPWSWRWRDLRRHWDRRVRQGRGRLENAAIKSIVYDRGYGALPEIRQSHDSRLDRPGPSLPHAPISTRSVRVSGLDQGAS